MARIAVRGWVDQDIVLYHGTLDIHVASLLAAIDVTAGTPLRDFGRGFYTTTNRTQAERWARDKAVNTPHQAAVVAITVSRNDLARLDCLFFVRGDPDALDYWSFVHHCRSTAGDHRWRSTPWYDVVAGPMSGSWKKQTVIANADQLSFHTTAAERVLNQSFKVQVP